jgi:hypothetical protein
MGLGDGEYLDDVYITDGSTLKLVDGTLYYSQSNSEVTLKLKSGRNTIPFTQALTNMRFVQVYSAESINSGESLYYYNKYAIKQKSSGEYVVYKVY